MRYILFSVEFNVEFHRRVVNFPIVFFINGDTHFMLATIYLFLSGTVCESRTYFNNYFLAKRNYLLILYSV